MSSANAAAQRLPADAQATPQGQATPGAPRKPRRRIASSKAAVMSPEARMAAERRNQQMVEEFLTRKTITECPARWALGAVSTSLFNGSEG